MGKRARVIIGYSFMIVGILMPLIAFSSMSYREISALKSYRAFQDERPKMSSSIESYNDEVEQNEGGIIDPFQNEDYKGSYNIDGFDPDDIFAYVMIPKLDLKKPIYLDASYDHLRKGVAQVEGTSLPLGGTSTRSVIAGHRGGWEDLFFYNIDELEAGDEIFIDSPIGLLKYSVSDKEVIGPGDWEKIMPIEGEDMVTLLTCEPKTPPRSKRLLVNAKRVEEPVVETQVDEPARAEEVKSVSYLKYGIYTVTVAGWICLMLVFVSLIKFLKRDKRRG